MVMVIVMLRRNRLLLSRFRSLVLVFSLVGSILVTMRGLLDRYGMVLVYLL